MKHVVKLCFLCGCIDTLDGISTRHDSELQDKAFQLSQFDKHTENIDILCWTCVEYEKQMGKRAPGDRDYKALHQCKEQA